MSSITVIRSQVISELDLPPELRIRIREYMGFAKQCTNIAVRSGKISARLGVATGGLAATGIGTPIAIATGVIAGSAGVLAVGSLTVSGGMYGYGKIKAMYQSRSIAKMIIDNREEIEEVVGYVSDGGGIIGAIIGLANPVVGVSIAVPGQVASMVSKILIKNAKRLNDERLKEIANGIV